MSYIEQSRIPRGNTLQIKENLFKKLNQFSLLMPGCLYWKDISGYYLGCNEGTLNFFNLELNDFVGKLDNQLWPELSEKFQEYDNQILAYKIPMTSEETIIINGEQRTFLITRAPWRDRDNVLIGTTGNICDISNFKRKESELKTTRDLMDAVDKAKTQFLHKMHAGIESRMTGIMRTTQYINDLVQDFTIKNQLEELLVSSNHMNNYIKNALDTLYLMTPKAFIKGMCDTQSALDSLSEVDEHLAVSQNVINPEKLISSVKTREKYELNRILIVEDHTMTATITKNLLFDLNCTVDVANSGEIALEKMDTNHYDLILMDVGLPDINGCEVTSRIRQKETDKAGSSVPIVGVTALTDRDEKQHCLEAGMNAVFTKPLMKEKLENVISLFASEEKVEQ